jgi:lysophospholipase L1-like esterase
MHRLLKLMLAPVLIYQGKQVRKNTPRLPEAPGPRRGIQGNGKKQIHLLILGDSAAAGVGVADQASALSGQTLACFGKMFRVEWELIAKTGATTADTLTHMESLPPTVFDVAVTSLGVNDVKTGVTTEQWMNQQKKLVCLLRKNFQVKQLLISAVPPMELFPALPWPLGFYLGLCSGQMNRSMQVWIGTQADCEFLKFDLPFDKNLMAEDGFHPGPKLHSLWGRQIFERISRHFGT